MRIIIIFSLILLFSTKNFAELPTSLNHNLWKEIPPANAKVNFYDELLLTVIPRVWNNVSPHGGNLGTKIEAEVMIWEGKDFCAHVFYDRTFDPLWAYDAAWIQGANLTNIWKQSSNSKKTPFFKEKCALFDSESPASGKNEGYNSRLTNIGKKKGMKGHKNPVRYQRFDYINPPFKCLFIAGGLGNSPWGSWTIASTFAHLCVNDASYFTGKKIKQLARSLGIKEGEASLKLKAEPPKDLTLDLTSFTTITGKRSDYSIKIEKSESKKETNQAKEENSLPSSGDSIEEKLILLKKMFDEKLISKVEYDSKRKEILDEL